MPRPPSAAVATTVADVVRRVPGVVDLDAGPLGTKVTYGSGGRVAGVTVHNQDVGRSVTVYLRVAWGPVRDVAEAAGDAARGVLDVSYPEHGPWRVDVEVTDIIPAAAAP